MNKLQLVTLWVVIAAGSAMLLFPPWQANLQEWPDTNGKVLKDQFIGWWPVFDCPKPDHDLTADNRVIKIAAISVPMAVAEGGILAMVAAGMIISLGRRDRPRC